MKNIILLLMHLYLFPHILSYVLSKRREEIDEDLQVMRDKAQVNYPNVKALVYLLIINKYYRNIFYLRIGRLSFLFSWLLPEAKDFHPCSSLGGVFIVRILLLPF